jgi:glycosyltransferase involved in cell wall biosynthesis
MKRVLIISSLFPPAGGPGAKRMIQFVNHLGAFGWEPIVLTHNQFFLGYDPKSVKLVPKHVEVHRTKTWEHYVRKKVYSQAVSNSSATSQKKMSGTGLTNISLVRLIKSTVGAPDTGILWMPFAVTQALKIHRKSPFDVMLATGPPFSNFLIGLVIGKLIKKPFVVDLRDAWVANPDGGKASKTKATLNRFYENIVVRSAKYVIANTDGVRQDFLSRYPGEDLLKFTVIPNGFDEKDRQHFKKSDLQLDKSRFNIVHTGSLGGFRNPKLFLAAVSKLIEEKKINPALVDIHLVGLIKDFNDGTTIHDQITKLKLDKQIKLTGFISREDAFGYMQEADILLLIIGVIDSEKYLATYGLSGKVYDYALTGKPILSLAQKSGATFNLLKKHDIGVIANPQSIDDIKEKILFLYNAWSKRELQSNYDANSLEAYNMKNLTRELSKLLDSSHLTG